MELEIKLNILETREDTDQTTGCDIVTEFSF